ncbi:N-acetylmuramoyl-L-alanine amidase [Brevibacillus sp. IT-7CA2]|nr:Cell Wall Hydrolase [Brevibacillus sp. BC25]
MRTIWIAGVLVMLVAAGLSGYKVVWKEKNVAAVQEEQMAAPAEKKQTAKTKASFHPSRVSDNDLKIMANAVYGESRGEPFEGQVAVAAVILNRVKSPSFPDTPSAVIFEPRAFTAVADGQIWLTPNESATKAVKNALNGWDPSGGCTYYFNPDTATSGWIWTRPQVKKIGKHIFCR